MAIAFVQKGNASAIDTLAFGVNVTAGSALIAIVRRGGAGTPTSITDTRSNTWVKLIDQTVSGDHTLSFWYALNTTAGANTVTQNGGSGSDRFIIAEYSGVATASAIDTSAVTTGTSSTPNSGNITTANADDLIIGGCSTVSGAAITQGSGYTLLFDVEQKVGGEYKIVSATGTYAANFTLGASDGWGCFVVAMKAAAGGGGGGNRAELVRGKLVGGLLNRGLIN